LKKKPASRRMHAVKRKMTVGMPIMGLTSDKWKKRVVAAVYFDPGS
jgi:hypothetical protein